MVTEQGAVACRGVRGRVRSPMDKTAKSAGVTPSTGRACDHLDDALAGFAVFMAVGPNITLSLGLAAAGSCPATDPRRASPELTLRRGCRCVDGRLVWPKHVVQRSVMRSGGIALASVREEGHEFDH